MMTGTCFSPGPRLDIQGAQWEIKGESEAPDPSHCFSAWVLGSGPVIPSCVSMNGQVNLSHRCDEMDGRQLCLLIHHSFFIHQTKQCFVSI